MNYKFYIQHTKDLTLPIHGIEHMLVIPPLIQRQSSIRRHPNEGYFRWHADYSSDNSRSHADCDLRTEIGDLFVFAANKIVEAQFARQLLKAR